MKDYITKKERLKLIQSNADLALFIISGVALFFGLLLIITN